MKIVIEGSRFDTEKAQHWDLSLWDGHNWIQGDLYRSSKGTWYVNTPSQWSNGHHWELTTPAQALEDYRQFLEDSQVEEISKYVDDWE
jgi:hypothetical protein